METYTDGRTLFLADADIGKQGGTQKVPVIDGWDWFIQETGKGCLVSPSQEQHCQFDLINATIAFAPGEEAVKAPGLSAGLVQEMGEKYAYEIVFSDKEKTAYDAHVPVRDATKKQQNRKAYDSLRGAVQLERRMDMLWLAHVNTARVQEILGEDSPHVLSREEGIRLFNRMAMALHAPPLKDPLGYMALSGNFYEFIQSEYRYQYEDVMQGIENNVIDGSGYGVEAVLKKLPSVVRQDITKDVLEREADFGDLRFLAATDAMKKAGCEFVKQRVSKTLTYERKRSYEADSIQSMAVQYKKASKELHDALIQKPQEPSLGL